MVLLCRRKWLRRLMGALLLLVTFRNLCLIRPQETSVSRPPEYLLKRVINNHTATHLDDLTGIPFHAEAALREDSANGYLEGNSTHLTFKPYAEDVDLRIIVMTFNRALSLHVCLSSLNQVDYLNSSVSLHIWVDCDKNGSHAEEVLNIAEQFNFLHGSKVIHKRLQHAGIQLQWVATWRPRFMTTEIGVILEDDMTVSPHFWKWLKPAHQAYDKREDISGYGLSHPGISHQHADRLVIPSQHKVYMYRVITTWGYSPHHVTWRKFQNWFYRSEQNSSFQPIVPNILPTQWYLSEKKVGRDRDLWTIWHIYYTHNHCLFTVLFNIPTVGLLAVNRHEKGLHDGTHGTGARDKLCLLWRSEYAHMPEEVPKFGYDGNEMKGAIKC